MNLCQFFSTVVIEFFINKYIKGSLLQTIIIYPENFISKNLIFWNTKFYRFYRDFMSDTSAQFLLLYLQEVEKVITRPELEQN